MERSLRLSEIPAQFAISTVRDGAFASLGFVSHETPGMLVFLESDRYLAELEECTHATAVIARPELVERVPARLAVASADSPRQTFYALHNHLAETGFYWTSFESVIAGSARVHPRAYVAARDVRIGEGVVIEPNATILERSIIEDGAIVRANAVIGSEGFQFVASDQALLPVAHAGGVRLETGVEIQSCTCVDRAVFGGFTVVGAHSKIDNLVHIAHNVQLGRRNRVVAGAMIAGSVRTGDDVWIGPMASISHELTMGHGANATMGAVVTRDVPAGQRVTGNFALEHGKFIAFMRSIR